MKKRTKFFEDVNLRLFGMLGMSLKLLFANDKYWRVMLNNPNAFGTRAKLFLASDKKRIS